MQYFLLGLAALALGLLILHGFARANVRVLARQIRIVVGVASLAAAAVLLIRGLASWAMPIAMLGAWLLWGGGIPGGQAQKTPGQTSRIVTDHLEMELDHDTGMMRGVVLKGAFAGRAIETMSPAEMAMLWQDCRFSDVQSATLIEAYLDSVHPSWREDMAKAGARGGPASEAMTREEALEILGLKPSASEADIRRAHRELIVKLHPDRGGSSYLAAKINQAKDVLLGE
jgi:hypothetical protein